MYNECLKECVYTQYALVGFWLGNIDAYGNSWYVNYSNLMGLLEVSSILTGGIHIKELLKKPPKNTPATKKRSLIKT